MANTTTAKTTETRRLQVMPCRVPVWTDGYATRMAPAHVDIELRDGRLSLSGVVGALSSGNCLGSAGQMQDSLKDLKRKPAKGWTPEMIDRLVDLWEKWHLNDMRPNCQHQTGPGWDASKQVTIYHFRLTPTVSKMQKDNADASMAALREGKPVQWDADTLKLQALEHKATWHEQELPAELAPFYEPNGPQYEGDQYNRPSETKAVGWLYPKDHPEGILTKPCEVCGYRYGSEWKREEVPADVIEWLFSLPTASEPCKWGSR